MGVAVAEHGASTRGSRRATNPDSPISGEKLPLLITLVALLLFGLCWLFGLVPALREERGLNARLSATLDQEQRVRAALQDRRQGMAAFDRDPEELIRALDETSTPPPPREATPPPKDGRPLPVPRTPATRTPPAAAAPAGR